MSERTSIEASFYVSDLHIALWNDWTGRRSTVRRLVDLQIAQWHEFMPNRRRPKGKGPCRCEPCIEWRAFRRLLAEVEGSP